MAIHRDMVAGEIHIPYQWLFATQADRLAASSGFTSTSVGKLARVSADNTLWMLTNHSPMTWVFIGGGSSLPTRSTLSHDESIPGVGAFTTAIDSGHAYNFVTGFAAPANGHHFSQTFLLKAGTYTFSVLGISFSDRGLIDWKIDGTMVVAAQDWYSAAGIKNVIKTASVTVATDGLHTLQGVINGKHASSSGYQMYLTKMWFRV